MTAASPHLDESRSVPQRQFQPLAGVLSYLVPGLGQIVQGRVAKGALFLVCVYALFFYGLYLGSGSITIRDRENDMDAGTTYRDASVVYMPTIDPKDFDPRSVESKRPALFLSLYHRPQFAGQFWAGVVAWPAIWQYLNYNQNQEHPWLKSFQREPTQATVNAVHNAGDKRLELAWVFTVIAGVLNILIIYDAVAGPAFLAANEKRAS